METSQCIENIKNPQSVISGLKSILLSSNFSDFIIILEEFNEKIYTHRQILASASPYFASILYGPFVEGSSKELRISDVDKDIFKKVLEFIYTGEAEITDTNLVKMVQIANRFCITEAIKEFTKAAQKIIERLDLSEESFFKMNNILCESYFGNLEDICEMCMEHVDINTRAYLESEAFLNAPREILDLVFARDTLYDGLEEISLYLACLRWARGFGGIDETDLENFELSKISAERFEELKKLIKHIRLPLIEADKIINKIDKSGLFSTEQLYLAMAYRASPSSYATDCSYIFKERMGSQKPWHWSEEKIGPHILLSTDKNMAIAHHYDWEKVIGNTTWYGGTHSFKVQLEMNVCVSSNSWQIIVGVASPSTSLNDHLGSGGKEWGLACYSGHKISCGDRREEYTGCSKKNDIIEVRVDLSLKTLEFLKNEKSLGIAYHNVTPPVCPAVSLLKGQRVRLVWD
jgi:BTB/POZ domain/SPRY domain